MRLCRVWYLKAVSKVGLPGMANTCSTCKDTRILAGEHLQGFEIIIGDLEWISCDFRLKCTPFVNFPNHTIRRRLSHCTVNPYAMCSMGLSSLVPHSTFGAAEFQHDQSREDIAKADENLWEQIRSL